MCACYRKLGCFFTLFNWLKVRAPGFPGPCPGLSLVSSIWLPPLLPHRHGLPPSSLGAPPHSLLWAPLPGYLAHVDVCLAHSPISLLDSRTLNLGVLVSPPSFLLLPTAPVDVHRPSFPNTCFFCILESPLSLLHMHYHDKWL